MYLSKLYSRKTYNTRFYHYDLVVDEVEGFQYVENPLKLCTYIPLC